MHPIRRTLLTAFLALFAVPAFVRGGFADDVANSTFKLDNSGSLATCFFVRRTTEDPALYLVTAAHVFADLDKDELLLVLRRSKPDGTSERCEHKLQVRREGRVLAVQHGKYDVSVMRITEELPVPVTALPLSAIADEAKLRAAGVALSSPLFVLGYPWGLEANAAGTPVLRQGIFASSPLLPFSERPYFMADYKAFPGDSGGPVFIRTADLQPLVVGLVYDENYYVDAKQTKIELGIANILHAQFVRETIELAAKAGAAAAK